MHLKDKGVKIVEIPSRDGGVVLEDVQKVVTPKTRVVTVSAVQFATGVRTDLAALGEFCQASGVLFCVDGIQQVGAFPLDVNAMHIDLLAADSHKWMLGLPGIGFAYVRSTVLPRLRPALVGWKSEKNPLEFDRLKFDLREDAAKLESGTQSFANILGLGQALALLDGVGQSAIASHITDWLVEAESALTQKGLRPGPTPGRRAGILTFESPSGTPEAFMQKALASRVHLSARRGRVRISPHLYSGERELSSLMDCVNKI
jgi:selenocysteine lyase/cysteine desulfurase